MLLLVGDPFPDSPLLRSVWAFLGPILRDDTTFSLIHLPTRPLTLKTPKSIMSGGALQNLDKVLTKIEQDVSLLPSSHHLAISNLSLLSQISIPSHSFALGEV